MTGSAVIPSPNIWNWPDLYEAENRAQDAEGVATGAQRLAAGRGPGHDEPPALSGEC